jgi:phospholipid/cholesterol/gamma-HCH transport system substrate-binding protein
MNGRTQSPSTARGAVRGVRRLGYAAAALACTTAVSACQFTGFGAMPLPFTHGTGSGSYTVTAVMDQIGNLAPNSEVMVNDISVGTVTAIQFDNWHAKLTISLPRSVKLPENATAKIGQKSLLGAEYVALAPPTNAPAAGQLHAGDVIGLTSTSTYPSTEDVLAALSTVLNGGGLNQLSTITRELNDTLAGHEQQARDLLKNLSTLIDSLNSQRAAIVQTLDSFDQLSSQLRAQQGTLATAIDRIPAGLKVLNDNEKNLTTALTAVSNLSTVGNRVINGTRQDLLANLRDLQPALARLADSGQNLVVSLPAIATYPFPRKTIMEAIKGDYANLSAVLDLSPSRWLPEWLPGAGNGSLGTTKPATKSRNPLTNPLQGVGGSLPGGSAPSPSPKPGGGSSGSGGGLGGVLGSLTGGGGG